MLLTGLLNLVQADTHGFVWQQARIVAYSDSEGDEDAPMFQKRKKGKATASESDAEAIEEAGDKGKDKPVMPENLFARWRRGYQLAGQDDKLRVRVHFLKPKAYVAKTLHADTGVWGYEVLMQKVIPATRTVSCEGLLDLLRAAGRLACRLHAV